MPKYKVGITRTGYSFREFEIDTENPHKAFNTSLDLAKNHEFSEHSSNYRIDYVEEIRCPATPGMEKIK